MDNPAIMENPDQPVQVATAGEALIDLIAHADRRYEACLGGAVYNLTRALARQDVGVAYLNPFSSDRFGRALAGQLVADGAHLAQPQAVAPVTSLAVVSLTEAGHPDYAFYREGVADRAVSAGQLIEVCAALPALRVVCTGALALAASDAPIYLPWLQAQRQSGAVIIVDANLRPSVMPDLRAYRANVQAAMALADVIKVSDEDLGHLGIEGADALVQAETLLHATRAAALLLTLGEQGACLLVRHGLAWRARESAPVEVMDTVGAGDCFLAGFVAALLRRPGGLGGADAAGDLRLSLTDAASARELLSSALASATLCVMRQGCVPPTRTEVAAWRQRAPCLFESA